MAKGIDEKIENIQTSWDGYTGARVEEFIKEEINRLNSNKMGYITEDNDKYLFYSSEKAFNNGESSLGTIEKSQRYSLDIQEDSSNKTVFLSEDTNKTFIWYFKTKEIATESVYLENVTVDYVIENITLQKTKKITTIINCKPDKTNEKFVNYTKVVMNLDEYLENGQSTIRISVKGLRTGLDWIQQINFSIITLNMEDITDFSLPFKNTFIAKTNINCTKLQNYNFEYRIDGGNFIFDEFHSVGSGYQKEETFEIGISNLAPGKHVFEYRLSIKLSDIEPYYTNTQRIEFIKKNDDDILTLDEPQILIFTTYYGEDSGVITAEDGNLLINGLTQYIPFSLKYAVYNLSGSTNLEFCDVIDGVDSNIKTSTISNGEILNHEIQSIESGLKQIRIRTKNSDEIITNGDGRIIYLNIAGSNLSISVFDSNLRVDFNSVGKNNTAERDTWTSIVNRSGGSSFVNNASFNKDYDWSQGWTSNGLVVSDGCEVTFDYAPFPLQKDNASAEEKRDYIGKEKGYTFEIEFMTQNVTNENAVVCDMTYNGCGLLITGTEFKFTTPNGNSVSTRFKDEEMNRAVIIIRPYLDSTQKFVKGLVELYINGVLSNITKYTEDEKFQVLGEDEKGNKISKFLTFKGSKGSDIVIKYIRTYNGVMTSDDVVNNYIIYRTDPKEMINLYNKNNVMNSEGLITPETMAKIGNIPIVIFIGRTNADELASGDGNENGDESYKPGTINANEENWYQTLEQTTDKKKNIDMDVIYYNPLDKRKNFKFVKAYITPQGTSSMYYPKKNYRVYTQKNKDTRCFFSQINEDTNELTTALELEQMLKSNFGESEEDRSFEKWRGTKNYKKRVYSFKDNSLPVKCWCLKADFAETSSSHNTGIARLWGEMLKESAVNFGDAQTQILKNVFKTTAQETIERKYNNNINKDMPDIRTTIDGFPIVVFGAKSYSDEIKFLGQYNFNNDKSTESVFGFCDIDDEEIIKFKGKDNNSGDESEIETTLDNLLDKYMTCVETLDNGNALANFTTMEGFDDNWEDAFEFRYPEIVEAPEESEYKDENGNWLDGKEEEYNKDYAEYEEDLLVWKNTHLKPFKHFAKWINSTKWCDVNGNPLEELSQEEVELRKEKFKIEKWDHLDVWKMAAYYVYAMRFGAVDQIVKNSMLTSEGPFAYNIDGVKSGYWDTTDINDENYGINYKWYYINYDNDTVMGVKNDGSLAYGPEITRRSKEGFGSTASYIYAGSLSTLWNNFDADEEFQNVVRLADQSLSKKMTYEKTIEMFDVEQVGKWCERIYNKDADYKYIGPYISDWKYEGDDENVENFTDKLFMLQGSRTAHRRWWLSKRFNLFDGKWNSGDFAKKYIEVKCNYGSIGDTFSAVAGANAYFGYQINNRTFGDGAADGGTSYECQSGDKINWKLYKIINIGDPIAIFGSADMLELNLMGLSNNLSSVLFYFGNNSNKLERLKLSIPDDLLLSESSYKTYSDDIEGTVNRKTAFDKLKLDYPEITVSNFEEGGEYPTSDTEFDPTLADAPLFFRIKNENETFTYFAKVTGGVRNYSCVGVATDSLDKLQELSMAGYMGVNSLDLSKNKFINNIDVRYSNINNITLSEGSIIKGLKASSALKKLSFNRCNNIKLTDIFIDSETLDYNKGKNINEISILNSEGLNHDYNFKNFILKWIKEGNVTEKSLKLTGINWDKVKVTEIEELIRFMDGDETTNGQHAISCNIQGKIKMSNENLSRENMKTIENFINRENIDVKIEIPTNILINIKESCVAGETVKVGCEIIKSKEEDRVYTIEYNFVKKVSREEEHQYYDAYTGNYYAKINGSDVRRGVTLERSNNAEEVLLKTDEIVINDDTETLLCVAMSIGTEVKTDIVPFIIKDPTYADKGKSSLKGDKFMNQEPGHVYEYDLSLLTYSNLEPIGTIDIDWYIRNAGGQDGNGLDFIQSSALTEDNKKLILTTKETTPERIAEFDIVVEINNYNDEYPDFKITKGITIFNENIIMTDKTNPIVMEICRKDLGKDSGWTSMSKDEAASISDEDLKNFTFNNVKSEFTFNEFVFFTNLTKLPEGIFKNSYIKSITLPNNISEIGISTFENCEKLEDITLPGKLFEIKERAFFNCKALKNLELPDSIEKINAYSFGGSDFKKILFKGQTTTEDKTIFISENLLRLAIVNNAFEGEKWNIEKTNSNVLNEVSIPSGLIFNTENYNFILSNYLEKINLAQESPFYLNDNILYEDNEELHILRVIPKRNDAVENKFFENTAKIFECAFYGCQWLSNIVFNSPLNTAIPYGAFAKSNIKTIDLSETYITSLESRSFYKLTELTSVKLPDKRNLKAFGTHLFYDCPNLIDLNLPDTLNEFKCTTNSESYTFFNCGFEELLFPSNITSSNYRLEYFINNCKNLKKIKLPDNFKITGQRRFINDCEKLEEVELPIFSYTNELGESEKVNESIFKPVDIMSYPFILNCPNLKFYKLNKNDNKEIFTDTIGDNIINGALYKKEEGNLTLYIVPYNLSKDEEFNKLFTDEVTKIDDSAFYNTNFEKISIPDSVMEIRKAAFYNCPELKEAYITKNIKYIANSLFLNCKKLEKVVVYGDIERIEQSAFNSCWGLNKLFILTTNTFDVEFSSLEINIEDITDYSWTYNPFGYDWAPKTFDLHAGISNADNIYYIPYNFDTNFFNEKYYVIGENNKPILEEKTRIIEKYEKVIYQYNKYETRDKVEERLEELKNDGLLSCEIYEINNPRFFPLFDKCKFRQELLSLNNETNNVYVTLKWYKNGEEVTDGTLYFKSDSGNLKYGETNEIASSQYFLDEGFRIYLNNKVHHNEPIYIYTDIECNTNVGEIIVKYGVNEYEINEEISTFNFRRTVSLEPEEDDVVNITKKDYEKLLSRINQMSEVISILQKK